MRWLRLKVSTPFATLRFSKFLVEFFWIRPDPSFHLIEDVPGRFLVLRIYKSVIPGPQAGLSNAIGFLPRLKALTYVHRLPYCEHA